MAAAVAAPAGRFAQRIGHEKVVAAGTLIVFTGYFFLSFLINETPHYATHYLPITIYTGIGVGLCISTISSSATAFLPQSRFAMGSALNNTFRQIGAALGVAVVSSILLASANSDSSHGFVVAWRLMSIVILFSGVSMLVIYRPPRTEDLIASSSTI
jgi:MFS family permease